MLSVLRNVKSKWRRTDTILHAANTFAFAMLIANCWWQHVWVVYLACGLPLLVQAWRSQRDAILRHAIVAGVVVGLTWPIGEGLVVRAFGWWGEYRAAGVRIWDTPMYCIVIGALASAHCLYVGRRAFEMGYGLRGWAFVSGLSAMAIGLIGENLFVWAGMWTYAPSILDIGNVPVFVPFAYGVGYSLLPLLRHIPAAPMALLFNLIMMVISVTFGLATGFFPRSGWLA